MNKEPQGVRFDSAGKSSSFTPPVCRWCFARCFGNLVGAKLRISRFSKKKNKSQKLGVYLNGVPQYHLLHHL